MNPETIRLFELLRGHARVGTMSNRMGAHIKCEVIAGIISETLTKGAEKMRKISVYKYSELSEEAKERALEIWEGRNTDIFWAEEIHDSWLATVAACGLTVKNYRIGAYYNSFIILNQFDGEELTGKRAFAWLENNLLSPNRIPWAGHKRWELTKYGRYYRPGMVKPCPFTGYCFDEDIIKDLKKEITEGSTLKEAFESLASLVSSTLEREIEYQHSEEYFSDHADANNYEFFDSGEWI